MASAVFFGTRGFSAALFKPVHAALISRVFRQRG
jgi:hypothetical protein